MTDIQKKNHMCLLMLEYSEDTLKKIFFDARGKKQSYEF